MLELRCAQSAVPAPVGIKMGDGRLHPFLELDGRYDSLIGYFSKSPGGQLVPSSDIVVHVRPGLKFDLESPSTLLRFGGAAEYLWYTGLLSGGTTGLSRFQGNASIDASFNRDGAAEVQLGDSFTRSDRTQNVAVGVGVLSLYNDVHLAVPIHPGGRAIEVTPRVGWGVELFDPLLTGVVSGCTNAADITCNPTLVGKMNYSNLSAGLGAKWKFLPKTALMLDGAFDWRTYLADTTTNPQAMVLRAQAGLLGLITPHLTVTLLAGYGGNFAAKLNTFIATTNLSYLITGDSKVEIGYVRTLQPVPVYGTFIADSGKLAGRLGLLGGRMAIAAAITVDSLSFSGATGRRDLVFGANIGPSYDVTSWFAVGASYNASLRSSSNAQLSSVNYVRHEALLRLTFRY